MLLLLLLISYAELFLASLCGFLAVSACFSWCSSCELPRKTCFLADNFKEKLSETSLSPRLSDGKCLGFEHFLGFSCVFLTKSRFSAAIRWQSEAFSRQISENTRFSVRSVEDCGFFSGKTSSSRFVSNKSAVSSAIFSKSCAVMLRLLAKTRKFLAFFCDILRLFAKKA